MEYYQELPMKSLSTLGLLTGIFLMLLALGIWSASHRPLRTGQAREVQQPPQTADAGRMPVAVR